MAILGKKQMSEEDIKLNYITPVIQRGWKWSHQYPWKHRSSQQAQVCRLFAVLKRWQADCRCGSKG